MDNKAFKYRIYPNKKQEAKLSQHFGACRFIYNYYLNERKEYHLKNKEDIEAKRIKSSLNFYDNAKDLTQLKKDPKYNWLNDVNAQSLQCTLRNLEAAYQAFFRKQNCFPKFKSKRNNHQSFKVPQHTQLINNKLFIPKFKEGIKIKVHRPIQGRIINVTISKTPTNKYYASVICETEIPKLPKNNNQIGIDLGLKNFIVSSDNQKYNKPKHLRLKEKQLKHTQRQLSKKKKTSSTQTKQRIKLARIHEKVSNSRKDFLHKLSTKLINENQVVCLENLHAKGLMRNHNLAKSISDASWGTFVSQLTYKANWYGRTLSQVGRFFPSSKMCHKCHFINEGLTLTNREWTCSSCGTKLDRDHNASLNILREGLNLLSDSGTESDLKQKQMEASSVEESMKSEASLT